MKSVPLVFLMVWAMACKTSQLPEVINNAEVSSAGGPPHIEKVTVLGTGYIPRFGPVQQPTTKTRAVIGALLLIEGVDFGRQPTVSIGGRSTSVLAHVRGGGLVVRVPAGIDPGMVSLEVTHKQGRTSTKLAILRLGAVATGRLVKIFNISASGATALDVDLPLSGARFISFGPDGSVAYASGVAERPTLWALDMATSPSSVVASYPLPGQRVIDLTTAEHDPLGVVITDTHLVFFEYQGEARPILHEPQPLPQALQQKEILAAALSPTGDSLALLLANLNQVALLNVEQPQRKLPPPAIVDVLPGERLSLVQDLQFSAEGIWVASGNTRRSMSGGIQTTTVARLQVAKRSPGAATSAIVVEKSWPIEGEWTPFELAVAQGNPQPPGTAIRTGVTSSAIYLAVMQGRLLAQDSTALSAAEAGVIVRSNPARLTEKLLAGPRIFISLDVVGAQSEILLSLACERKQQGVAQVLYSKQPWTRAAPAMLALGQLDHPGQGEGFSFCQGTVRAQP